MKITCHCNRSFLLLLWKMMLEAEWMIQAGKCSEVKSTDGQILPNGCSSNPGLLLFTFSGHARLVQPTPLTHWTLSFTIIQVSRLIYQGNTPNTITTPSHTLATPLTLATPPVTHLECSQAGVLLESFEEFLQTVLVDPVTVQVQFLEVRVHQQRVPQVLAALLVEPIPGQVQQLQPFVVLLKNKEPVSKKGRKPRVL